jgi:hypothetical protein
MKAKVRMKPCPYCEKKLQAPNKLKWRNNLARHLGNACPPYEKRMIEIGLRIFEGVAFSLTGRVPDFNPAEFKGPDQIRKEQQEIRELEALYKHKSVPTRTTEPAGQNSSPTNPEK